MARMLNFAAVRVESSTDGLKKKPKPNNVVLYGRAALEYELKRVQQKATDGCSIDSKDIKLLKTFRWSLAAPQVEQLDRWQADAIHSALVMYKRIQDKKEELSPAAASSLVLATTSSASSSSSSALVLKTKHLPSLIKPKKTAAELGGDSKKELLKFFNRKSAA
jgi:hypothetical protein